MLNYQKLISQPLPNYSRGEEIFNLVTHIVGAAMGFIFLIIGSYLGIKNRVNAIGMTGICVYGVSMITLYTISSVYHGLSPQKVSKKILRILDHCTIYLLIAGTYTPIICLSMQNTDVGIIIFIIEWLGALIGIILNAIDMENKYVKVISMFLYIFMGWVLVFIPSSLSFISNKSFMYILSGGIFYMIGVVFYGIGPKKKWFHSIFHIFCDLGTLIQFFGIIYIIYAFN